MPPDPPNSDIANYTIMYRPVEAVADYDPSTLEGNTTNYTDANTTVLMAVGLQSAVLYSIQLAATNQVGTSPFNQDLECTALTQDDREWGTSLLMYTYLLFACLLINDVAHATSWSKHPTMNLLLSLQHELLNIPPNKCLLLSSS